MDLSPGAWFGVLVAQPSRQAVDLRLVEPGAPDESYLMFKLRNTMRSIPACEANHVLCGVRMPLDGALPTADEIATVRAWIARGAPES